MTRQLSLAAAALVLFAASMAQAQTDKVAVPYNPAKLATAAGREAVKSDIAATADAYCRAHPVGDTVSTCRAVLIAQITAAMGVRVQEQAKAVDHLQYAQR